MNLDDKVFMEAYRMWNSFKQEIIYKHRFLRNHEVLEHITNLAEQSRKIIEKDTILYRARLYTGDTSYIPYMRSGKSDEGLDESGKPLIPMPPSFHPIKSRQKSGFWGYGEKDSFVPPTNDFIGDGRANPSYIKYLYTAEDAYTAVAEVRPYLSSTVSLAEIKINEKLTVADFSVEGIHNMTGLAECLMFYLMKDFSRPSESDKKNYIPTQYVSEYIKTLGLDGIRFSSSLHSKGRNVTIFNYDNCQPINSKLFEIRDICFEVKAIAPVGHKDLIHWKLEAHEQKHEKYETLFSLYKESLQKNIESTSTKAE